MLKACIEKLIAGEELTATEIAGAIDEMLAEKNPEQCAALLVLLRRKGETADDVQAFVQCMRQKMTAINYSQPVLDIVGTGGDGFNTINISTSSALLAASCGVKVLKHGNRSVSSLTGSADLMEAFGYHLGLADERLMDALDTYNFGFCYAPNYHPSFAAIKPIRKSLGVPSVFNLMGPLLNPATAEYLLMGVGDKDYLPVMAQALQQLGVKQALVFNCCGLDEICTVGPIDVVEASTPHGLTAESSLKAYQLLPEDFGFKRCTVEDLHGGTAAENKEIVTEVLQGAKSAIADTLVFNAGLACYSYGVADTVESGIELALKKQQSGEAYDLLQAVVKHSRESSHA